MDAPTTDAAPPMDAPVDAPSDAPVDAAPDALADAPGSDAGGPTGLRVGHVAAGRAHTCAVEAGTRNLFCWGDHQFSQVGVDDGATMHVLPVRVNTSSWAEVSAENDHTCAIREEGSLFCWGEGAHGRLGGPDTNDSPVPRRVDTGTMWMTVSAGHEHTCAVTHANDLFCWGRNNQDQLGSSRADGPELTQEMSNSTWLSVAAGKEHTCGVATNNSRVWCWGRDDQGQLGLGSGDQSGADPGRVDNSTSYRMLAAGGKSTCAIEEAGLLSCWGQNNDGQLGLGDSTKRDSPAQVGGANDWIWISIHAHHACGIRASTACTSSRPCGDLYCWGKNDKGQLGTGSTSSQATPAAVNAPGTWFTEVSTGETHTCAIDTDQRLLCFGGNAAGQLGLGDQSDRVLPELVE